jgi:hypothetical protein
MKSGVLFLVICCFITSANAQGNNERIGFPSSFIGNWKGKLEWTQTGSKEPRRETMQLLIQASKDSAGQYSWNLIYGAGGADDRPYILKPIDTANGHWVIDEVNGIVLDQYWIANKLCGVFTVQNTTIVNSYWIDNGKLYVEFISYASKPLSTTGKGDNAIPFVDSYHIKSYQRAVLEKIQ